MGNPLVQKKVLIEFKNYWNLLNLIGPYSHDSHLRNKEYIESQRNNVHLQNKERTFITKSHDEAKYNHVFR